MQPAPGGPLGEAPPHLLPEAFPEEPGAQRDDRLMADQLAAGGTNCPPGTKRLDGVSRVPSLRSWGAGVYESGTPDYGPITIPEESEVGRDWSALD